MQELANKEEVKIINLGNKDMFTVNPGDMVNISTPEGSGYGKI